MYPKNAASPPRISVGAVVQISDGAVQTSGVSVAVVPQGGASGAGGGTTAYDNGIVLYTPTQAETNYAAFVVTAYKTGCIPATVTVVTTTFPDMVEDDLGVPRFTANALEQAPAAAGPLSAGDVAQIRSRLAMDGAKTTPVDHPIWPLFKALLTSLADNIAMASGWDNAQPVTVAFTGTLAGDQTIGLQADNQIQEISLDLGTWTVVGGFVPDVGWVAPTQQFSVLKISLPAVTVAGTLTITATDSLYGMPITVRAYVPVMPGAAGLSVTADGRLLHWWAGGCWQPDADAGGSGATLAQIQAEGLAKEATLLAARVAGGLSTVATVRGQRIEVVRGDTARITFPTLDATWDLTTPAGRIATFTVKRKATDAAASAILSAAATISSARVIYYDPAATDFDTAGEYAFDVQITNSDGSAPVTAHLGRITVIQDVTN